MRQDHLAWGLEKQSAKIRRPDEGGALILWRREGGSNDFWTVMGPWPNRVSADVAVRVKIAGGRER